MVVVRDCEWQNWQSCGRLKIGEKNGGKKLGGVTMGRTRRHSQVGSGSGRVGVVRVERGYQGGSNDSG
jgi:hypothetical protein